MRRHHVIRQIGLELGFQLLAQISFVVDAVRGNHVAHQLLTARPVLRQHHGFAHGVEGIQACFDFAEFDTETTDFHLMVDAPDVLDHAVAAVLREVTSAVQTRPALAKWIGNEAQCGEVATVQIPACQTGTADVQLTDAALGHRIQLAVEHVPRQVGDRLTDRAVGILLKVSNRQRTIRHVHGGFGDAVHVDQLRGGIAETLKPRTQGFHVQCFAAEYHVTQGVRPWIGASHVHQLLERRWRLVEHGDPGVAQQRMEVLRRTADVVRHHQQLAAVQQRTKNLPHREIEGVGMEQAPDVFRAETEPRFGGFEQAQDVLVRQQRTFGFAGGAGGVNHVSEVRRRHRHLRIGVGKCADIAVQQQGLHALRHRQLTGQNSLAQQQLNAAVLNHVGQTILRIGRVERHVSTASLEDRQQADNHFQTTLGGQTDQHVRADAEGDQLMRAAVGLTVEFAVAQGLLVETYGDGIGTQTRLLGDQLMRAGFAQETAWVRVPLSDMLLLLAGVEQRQFTDA